MAIQREMEDAREVSGAGERRAEMDATAEREEVYQRTAERWAGWSEMWESPRSNKIAKLVEETGDPDVLQDSQSHLISTTKITTKIGKWVTYGHLGEPTSDKCGKGHIVGRSVRRKIAKIAPSQCDNGGCSHSWCIQALQSDRTETLLKKLVAAMIAMQEPVIYIVMFSFIPMGKKCLLTTPGRINAKMERESEARGMVYAFSTYDANETLCHVMGLSAQSIDGIDSRRIDISGDLPCDDLRQDIQLMVATAWSTLTKPKKPKKPRSTPSYHVYPGAIGEAVSDILDSFGPGKISPTKHYFDAPVMLAGMASPDSPIPHLLQRVNSTPEEVAEYRRKGYRLLSGAEMTIQGMTLPNTSRWDRAIEWLRTGHDPDPLHHAQDAQFDLG